VWYTVISALVGGLDGARMGLGEVGTGLVSVCIKFFLFFLGIKRFLPQDSGLDVHELRNIVPLND